MAVACESTIKAMDDNKYILGGGYTSNASSHSEISLDESIAVNNLFDDISLTHFQTKILAAFVLFNGEPITKANLSSFVGCSSKTVDRAVKYFLLHNIISVEYIFDSFGAQLGNAYRVNPRALSLLCPFGKTECDKKMLCCSHLISWKSNNLICLKRETTKSSNFSETARKHEKAQVKTQAINADIDP